MRPNDSALFWSHVNRRGPDDCWPWLGHLERGGYGRIRWCGRMLQTHRLAYQIQVGSIPEGLTIDHLCHGWDQSCSGGTSCEHRRCCNPSHLEPVTRGENLRRGRRIPEDRTFCAHGHPWTEENVIRDRYGFRRCRICDRAKSAAWYARHRGGLHASL